ncbi:class I SAM-dependent methyltransferase [Pseudonocardia humida]|uniref:Class I SAM-dependent methyltransferase n=1 Tax=Pseudonocardia humida TaxID=2800819 RepID=A0ABT0ZTV7_9PSEU|nr:class I SAM-dependent methyltransferase [Pseudonocardia humida]MCO1654165.1 class I SAM-dependent methyltransferase [Pseudonocardia humida]
MTEIPTAANTAQQQAWDGATGAFWAEHADRFDRGVAAYDPALERAAALSPGERVLEVGCGTGHTTRAAARRVGPTGSAHGVDLSTRMLDLARSRAAAEGLRTVAFTRADAQVHPFPPAGADVVISRHGAMFFDDPVAAFANLGAALRPGGRFALLVWQGFGRNPFMHRVADALTPDRDTPQPPADGRPGPLSLSDPARARAVLTDAGCTAIRIEPVEEPMHLGTDPADAMAFLTAQHAGLLAGQDPRVRARAVDRLRADVAAHHRPGRGVRYPSACWLITARTAGTSS